MGLARGGPRPAERQTPSRCEFDSVTIEAAEVSDAGARFTAAGSSAEWNMTREREDDGRERATMRGTGVACGRLWRAGGGAGSVPWRGVS
ncbi:MAG TPA: hypothetical protein VMJ70_13205 [Candidatus Sulfotelmatobacter sp.]|nr:hypothetical protein [Candidatus Sulfotelmatobacter sp.]